MSSLALTVLTLLTGVIVTALVLSSPHLLFGWHSPSLHVVVDTVGTSVALLVSYLVVGRYLRDHRLQDLVLALGLAVWAVARPAALLATVVVDQDRPLTLDVWTEQSVRLLAAVLMATAALAGDRRVPPRAGRAVSAAVASLACLTVITLAVSADRLPVAVTDTPESAVDPVITGHPALLGAHTAGALLFGVAAVIFTIQAGRRDDELLRWIGPAYVVAAFSRLHYVLFPSIYSGWIYTGDLLRMACHALLLVGAAREISRYWTGRAEAAVLEDRRRIAREIHDGVLQELTLIRTEAHEVEDELLQQRVIDSVDRGIDEARAAIEELDRLDDVPLGELVERAAQRVMERYDGTVSSDVDLSLAVTPWQRHALVRITREAVLNAVRHSGAHHVDVSLRRDADASVLVVRDNGRGFDAHAGRPGGYGLTSMRERARHLPGTLELETAPGSGTTIEVRW